MIEILEKTDLLELFKEKKLSGIAHQCNDIGVMKSGIALKIAQKWPEAERALQENHALGSISFAHVEEGDIWNLVGQKGFGGMGRFTNYNAIYLCLEELETRLGSGYKLGIPYLMSSDRGGADWRIIYAMLEVIFGESETQLFICKLK